MPPRVLCVTEKPSISRALANALSGGDYSKHPTSNKYIYNYAFHYTTTSWGPCKFTVTAASGHITDMFFPLPYSKFDYDPKSLLSAPIETKVTEEGLKIAQNITKEAKFHDILYIWTDCDREGEHIGAEVHDIAIKSNPRMVVYRATFNNTEISHLKDAVNKPGKLDFNQVEAVNVRIELDLRSGFSMTRLQTNLFRKYLGADFARKVISYGSCQFPTLGFVVDRAQKKEKFKEEMFWTLEVGTNDDEFKFKWKRGRLFDQVVVLYFYEKLLESNEIYLEITKIKEEPSIRYKPLPLTTVSLQQKASKALKMSAKEIMDHAERLYNDGLVSYPRTETDRYDESINLTTIVQKQTNQSVPWSSIASKILLNGVNHPRAGKHDDHAHPPIHPVQSASKNTFNGNERKWQVYEFICRHFLATCMQDAHGVKTTVSAKFHTESFVLKGERVLQQNFLEVYTYMNWGGKMIPAWEVGNKLLASSCMMLEKSTTPPKLLTEADLVGLMNANGIGTDATMADHIAKIQERDFVKKQGQYFEPTKLGTAIVLGYEKLDLPDPICKPSLRRDTEVQVSKVSRGEISRVNVLKRLIERYESVFQITSDRHQELITEVQRLMSV